VVSFGVVIAALVITLTGWLWVDPATSLIVAALVLVSGWGLARDSVNLALDAVPAHIDFTDVRDYLAGLDGVSDVHDLHIWAMSTSETAMTVHLVRPGGFDDAFLHGLCEELSHRFRIQHPTIQIEASHETCRLAPADVV
jgi:cobalt-zinc-cadmium efflux system protein